MILKSASSFPFALSVCKSLISKINATSFTILKIFEISTFAGSRERAKQISDGWKNNANTIYPKIIDLLLNGENNEKE